MMHTKSFLTMKIDFTQATFVKSAPSVKEAPQEIIPEALL